LWGIVAANFKIAVSIGARDDSSNSLHISAHSQELSSTSLIPSLEQPKYNLIAKKNHR
jgi:hypothetical protein